MTTNAPTHETTRVAEKTMERWPRHRYGSPAVLELTDTPKPEIGMDPILVRIRAASLNSLDWRGMRGEPIVMMRPMTGFADEQPVRGVDLAGVVEAVGPGVTEFKVGDQVFGTRSASWAEYVTGREMDFADMPLA